MTGWAPAHDAMLKDLHPDSGMVMRDIAKHINMAFGTNYNARTISDRSAQLGLPKRGQPYAPPQRASQWWLDR